MCRGGATGRGHPGAGQSHQMGSRGCMPGPGHVAPPEAGWAGSPSSWATSGGRGGARRGQACRAPREPARAQPHSPPAGGRPVPPPPPDLQCAFTPSDTARDGGSGLAGAQASCSWAVAPTPAWRGPVRRRPRSPAQPALTATQAHPPLPCLLQTHPEPRPHCIYTLGSRPSPTKPPAADALTWADVRQGL